MSLHLTNAAQIRRKSLPEAVIGVNRRGYRRFHREPRHRPRTGPTCWRTWTGWLRHASCHPERSTRESTRTYA